LLSSNNGKSDGTVAPKEDIADTKGSREAPGEKQKRTEQQDHSGSLWIKVITASESIQLAAVMVANNQRHTSCIFSCTEYNRQRLILKTALEQLNIKDMGLKAMKQTS